MLVYAKDHIQGLFSFVNIKGRIDKASTIFLPADDTSLLLHSHHISPSIRPKMAADNGKDLTILK